MVFSAWSSEYFAFSHPLLLCQWREILGGTAIKFSETDFISQSDPEALLPYKIFGLNRVIPVRSGQNRRISQAYYPGEVRDIAVFSFMVLTCA